MKKFIVFPILLIIAPILAALYGILHDQLTYTISPEYYTKFKFIQFGLVNNEAVHVAEPRLAVAYVGAMATWWMGIPIGIILSLIGLIHNDGRRMFRITAKAFLITVAVAFLTGLIGLTYGHFYLSKLPKKEFQDWFLPENLIDFKNFVKVGSMHNFSYVGGAIGLLCGIIYSIIIKFKIK